MSENAHVFLSDSDIALLLNIANLACHKGLVLEARTIVDGVLAQRPGFAPAIITLAYSHLVVDDFEKAQEMLEALLETSPNDLDARVVQGLSFLLSGRKQEALATFAEIPEDTPQKALAQELAKTL